MPVSAAVPDLSFAVVGAGAVGSVIGWRLARAEASLLMVGRGPHLQAMQRDGLRLTDGQVDARLPVRCCTDTRGEAPHDVVFVATTAQDIESALDGAAALIGQHTVVIAAVNGLPWWYFQGVARGDAGALHAVDPEGRLFQRFAPRQLIGAVVHIGASLPGPGHVAQTGGHGLILGELDNAVTERARAIAQVLDCGGLPTQVSTSIRDDIWSKLVGNISTNPLSVVTGATLDRLFNEPGLRRLVTAVMLETMTVGAGYGVRFALDPAQRIDLGRRLGAFRTSMLQDFDRGRPLELGAIVDAVLELAERIGVPMPMTTLVRDLADVAQRSARLLQETT